jgi:hypothetical protein
VYLLVKINNKKFAQQRQNYKENIASLVVGKSEKKTTTRETQE